MDILVRFLNPLLMIVFGLMAGVIVIGRRADGWRLYFAGVWTFILSQVFHLPFNAWVLNPYLQQLVPEGLAPGSGLIVAAVLLGLSAGVFEEMARYLAYRLAIRYARSWRAGLAFGAGHGGIEAILVGLLALSTVLQLVALRGPDAGALLTAGQLEGLAQSQAQLAAFWDLPWYGVLLGALERVFAICFHLSAALLVLQAVRRRNLLWLAAAILWHTALNAVAVVASALWGLYAAEGALGLLAAASLWIIFRLREEVPDREPPPALPPLDLERTKLSAEDLEHSRYGDRG